MSESLIVLGAVAGVVILVLFSRGLFKLLGPSRSKSAGPAFVGDPQNDKRVVVRGWRPEELRGMLADFAASYELPKSYVETGPGAVDRTKVLTFPRDIPPEVFLFLVNYLTYPFKHEPRDSLAVVGTATLTSAFALPDPSLVGKQAFVYVPDADQEHDVVYVDVVGDAVYAVPFTNLRWQRVELPRRPPWLREM